MNKTYSFSMDASQMAFLRHHRITLDDIFDGRLIPDKHKRRLLAEQAGKLFVYSQDCSKDKSHWIENRNGRCIQCNTAYIEFQRRDSATGYVYIAGSLKKKLIKVGFTSIILDREKSINKSLLADANDWKILTWKKIEGAGSVEGKTHQLLKEYLYPCTCKKSGKEQSSKEVFSCSFLKALEALNSAMQDEMVYEDKPIKADFVSDYCGFPNVKRP